MAPKSAFAVLALFLVLSCSAAAEQQRLQPEVAAGCWKEIYQVPNCFFSILKAFLSKSGGSPIDVVAVPCCTAFLSLTGDCQVEIFQNSTVIPLIETFCSAIVDSSGGDVPPPVAPAPENGGGDWPWPSSPVAPGPVSGGDEPWPAPGPYADEADVDSSFSWPTVRFL